MRELSITLPISAMVAFLSSALAEGGIELFNAYVMRFSGFHLFFLLLHILLLPVKEKYSGNNMTSFQLALQTLESSTGFCPRTASNCF